MPQSFVSNNIHIIFSTRDRRPCIRAEDQLRLWKYLAGIARNSRIKILAIGGTADHVHLLLALPADLSIAKTVNLLKSNSSKWMRSRQSDFSWQQGYGAFSVSASNVQAVADYIENQIAHHKRRDFRQELFALLRKHGVPYDEKYLLR